MLPPKSSGVNALTEVNGLISPDRILSAYVRGLTILFLTND